MSVLGSSPGPATQGLGLRPRAQPRGPQRSDDRGLSPQRGGREQGNLTLETALGTLTWLLTRLASARHRVCTDIALPGPGEMAFPCTVTAGRCRGDICGVRPCARLRSTPRPTRLWTLHVASKPLRTGCPARFSLSFLGIRHFPNTCPIDKWISGRAHRNWEPKQPLVLDVKAFGLRRLHRSFG